MLVNITFKYAELTTSSKILSLDRRMVHPCFKQDHFGLDGLMCQNCRTYRDFVWQAMSSFLGYYAFSGILVNTAINTKITILSLLKLDSSSVFWKLNGFIGLAVLELYLMVQEHDPFPYILPSLHISDKIVLLRHLFVIGSLALNHIGPALFPADKRSVFLFLM